ncbi:MAG TPA: RNA-binding cell elongation regulator Jag/EloR [Acidimicrobiales bacterium]|nr:RNA-binding cell elongation regulator Jag/EloR [Acidimicrobiales bacterium]
MEWVETTGRTIEEAKEAALDRLGIDETDAEFEILEEPRLGLFGRLRSEARVRARVRPNRPRPKDERRDRRRRGSKGGSPAPERPPAAEPAPPTPTPRQPPAPPQGAEMDRDVPLRDQADVAQEFLTGLLGSFDTEGRVEVREVDEDTVELLVDGPELRLLIGPGGATLGAVQEVTRRVVQHRTGARNGRLLVDVSGYRSKRKAALERFVQSVAADVRSSGVAKALEPMSAADRKVVHDTVNQLEGVSTTSEGEEPRRRVVISPA